MCLALSNENDEVPRFSFWAGELYTSPIKTQEEFPQFE